MTAGNGPLGLDNTFDYSGSVVHVTVAFTGDYDISLDGAQGGGNFGTGGLGAAVGGEIFLTAGTHLNIIVGGEGVEGDGSSGGGGGGASYIVEVNGLFSETILAVAGGGGGAGASSIGHGGVASAHGGTGGGLAGGAGGSGDNPGAGGGDGGGGGGFTGGAGAHGSTAAASGIMNGFTYGGGSALQGGAGAGGFGGGGGGGLGGGGGGGLGGGGGGFNGGGGGGGGSYLDTALVESVTETGGDSHGEGQVKIDLVLCFASGTRIRTAGGDIAVEDLKVGDLAIVASGAARPIRWIGRRRIERPSRERRPVRVMAGAFGEGLPRRDLMLSPGHAVCVEAMGEVFVPVGQLINGATIAQLEVPEVTYWHVELESHDVLLAEGLPCESYMDAGARAWFGQEYGRLAEIDPDRLVESLGYYARPFVDAGPVVEAIRERLAARAKALGWVPTSDMDLRLVVDGARIEPAIDGDRARFVFPAGAREARLVSRTFVPGADRRVLGVRIERLRVTDGLRVRRAVGLSAISGFHPEEAAGGCAWRWTDGDLALPATLWAGCNGQVILCLDFDAAAAGCWLAPEFLRAAA